MALQKNNNLEIDLQPEPLQQFEEILRKAIEKKASDIHLKVGLPPIVRIHGSLFYLKDKQKEVARLSSSELINIAHELMNQKQLEKYQDGHEVDLGYQLGNSGRFRINICQGQSDPRIVCRHIPDDIPSLGSLGLPPVIEKLTTLKRGLILVTGATGSGKSTTLAAMIDLIAKNHSCHIVTIEDPIEFSFKDRKSIVTQREVGRDTMSFSHGLKYSLRQDPDVILVGEMRDEETMLMALTAATTGHLVFSTLHTVDASETINRILAGISTPGLQNQVRLQLSTQLMAVISQRLLVTKDGKSRVPAAEILIHNRRVQDIIADPKRTHSLREVMEQSRHQGMQSFDQCLMELYQRDVITKEEALAHCSNIRDFQLRLEGVMPGEWTSQQNDSDIDLDPKSIFSDPNAEKIEIENPQDTKQSKSLKDLAKKLPLSKKE